MSPGLIIEEGVLLFVAGGGLWKLNHLEDNEQRFPNSAGAFFLILCWLAVVIWAGATALIMLRTNEMISSGWPAFWAAILILTTHVAQKSGLLNSTVGKAKKKVDADAPVDAVVCVAVADTDDDDVLAGDFADRIREREFKAMRPVGQDTDEYSLAVDGESVTTDGDAKPLPDVLPGGSIGNEPK